MFVLSQFHIAGVCLVVFSFSKWFFAFHVAALSILSIIISMVDDGHWLLLLTIFLIYPVFFSPLFIPFFLTVYNSVLLSWPESILVLFVFILVLISNFTLSIKYADDVCLRNFHKRKVLPKLRGQNDKVNANFHIPGHGIQMTIILDSASVNGSFKASPCSILTPKKSLNRDNS